jgi:hypothetical protein
MMPNVSVVTFAVEADAAETVREQLTSMSVYLRTCKEQWKSFTGLTNRFDCLLGTSAVGFKISYCPPGSEPVQVIYRAHQKTTGTLYLLRNNQLQTINLLLSGVNRQSDILALEHLGRTLSPLDEYFQSLAVVRFGGRPIVATFRNRFAAMNRTVEAIQRAFTVAFFRHCGIN